MLNTAKNTYLANTISAGEGNTRRLFSTVKRLLKPPNSNTNISEDYCTAFLKFFDSNISNIHQQLALANITQAELPAARVTNLPPPAVFCNFSLPTEDFISELITKSNSSTCHLDPIPTSLVKTCLPALTPLITSIIKSSLSTGTVPASLKAAIVRPTLKKPGLDCNNLNNYRPISIHFQNTGESSCNPTPDLPTLIIIVLYQFISKTLERVVATQLQTYLQENNLLEQFQSGFRSRHSTETALVKITNNLLRAADAGLLSILILLDLSAAFDTISHQLLLERLESIGVCGTALKWFAHHLTDRTYFVQIERPPVRELSTPTWRSTGVSIEATFIYHLPSSTRQHPQTTWHPLPLICR